MLIAAEYIDTWQVDADGNTCCQQNDLRNDISGHIKRIDQIFVCNSETDVTVLMTQTVGDQPSDRLASGVWPSDHAGVVAQITLE